ncbi:MAG: hypothetical protein AAFQ95_23535 [Cyanobacteria bacterium J06621_3]
MTLEKRLCLWMLMPLLGGCTFLTIEEPDPVANTASQIEESDPVASTAFTVEALETEESDLLTGVESGVEIEFVESAPKDRFVITNTGSCALEDLMLELDLSQSAGMLIFDTSAAGAGVEVFQPFEVEQGDIVQLAADSVNDGDVALALRVVSLAPGDTASFTIDVDDTLPRGELGQIRVTDSEISGAIASITVGESETTSTAFDNGSVAQANLSDCLPVQ